MLGNNSEQAEEVFSELFLRSCPKFVSPTAPPYQDATLLDNILTAADHKDDAFDPTRHHHALFIASVRPTLSISDLRSFLRLYTTLGADKLAGLMGKSEEEVLEEVAVMKGSMRGVRWTAGKESLLEGDLLGSDAQEMGVGVEGVSCFSSSSWEVQLR
jgi:translation initiation factor 3 subunit L